MTQPSMIIPKFTDTQYLTHRPMRVNTSKSALHANQATNTACRIKAAGKMHHIKF